MTALLDPANQPQDDVAMVDALAAAVRDCAARVVLVSPEVGLSLVPVTPVGRAFADALGTANQALAAACDRVALVVAGQVTWLKAHEPEARSGQAETRAGQDVSAAVAPEPRHRGFGGISTGTSKEPGTTCSHRPHQDEHWECGISSSSRVASCLAPTIARGQRPLVAGQQHDLDVKVARKGF